MRQQSLSNNAFCCPVGIERMLRIHLANQYLKENGMKLSQGTIVDASIVQAPGSSKNKKK